MKEVRSHVDTPSGDGADFLAGEERVWTGPVVPSFVPQGTLDEELILLDPISATGLGQTSLSMVDRGLTPASSFEEERGYFALYRQMSRGDDRCSPVNHHRCRLTAAFFSPKGALLWIVPLAEFVDDEKALGIEDIRTDGQTLYFNEKCLRYDGQGQRGECGAVVAIEPREKRFLWRSRPGVSAHQFALMGDYLASAWPTDTCGSRFVLLRRADGQVIDAPNALAPLTDDQSFVLPLQRVVFSEYGPAQGCFQVDLLALDESAPARPRLRRVAHRSYERYDNGDYERELASDCSPLPGPLPPAFPWIPGCPGGRLAARPEP